MGEPTTGPASCAYQHSAREEASGRIRGATCKVVVSEPCQRNSRSVAPEPLKRAVPRNPRSVGPIPRKAYGDLPQELPKPATARGL